MIVVIDFKTLTIFVFLWTEIMECSCNPCQNGATCVDGLASFECVCASGWQGITCAEGTQRYVKQYALKLGSRCHYGFLF